MKNSLKLIIGTLLIIGLLVSLVRPDFSLSHNGAEAIGQLMGMLLILIFAIWLLHSGSKNNLQKRPFIITLICIGSFIGVYGAMTGVFFEAFRGMASWYPPYVIASGLVGLAAFIGLWLMKRWGVMLYTFLVAVNQLVLLLGGLWTPSALLIPLMVIFIGFFYYKRMTPFVI